MPGSRTHKAMLALAVAVPAVLAAAHVANVADAAHDEGVVRGLGLSWTGAWHALDAALSALAMALPIGTRAARAGLAFAAVAGVASGVLYALARRLTTACTSSPRSATVAAALGALAIGVSPVWQLEAASAGGAILGGLLVLASLAFAVRRDELAAALTLGLVTSLEPVAGGCALAACATYMATARVKPSHDPRQLGALFVLGLLPCLVPFAVAIVRARAGHSMMGPTLIGFAGERGASPIASPLSLLRDELGWIFVGLAVAGAFMAAFVARARPLAASLLALALTGTLATFAGAPAGPSRFGASVVAAAGAMGALSAVGMLTVVRAVAAARVPFARASATMIVVLLLTFPVHMADDTIARAIDRPRDAAAVWEDAAWGMAPAGAIVFVGDPRLMKRALASRASGRLRADLELVPTFDLGSPMARRALVREPKLAAFWRDVSLAEAPEEFSLSEIAAARPLIVADEPRWERALVRHLVPLGLVAVFELEPRGESDRRRALDAFTPSRERLAKLLTQAHDAELADATTALLRARAMAFAQSGDRETVGRAIDDLHAFSPDDPIASMLLAKARRR